ncbi:MAG: hypothetical protein AAFQ87_20315 [Bacteroidota bacterium]
MPSATLPPSHPYQSLSRNYPLIANRLQRLTHRHLFFRALVPAVSSLDYGMLIPTNCSLSVLGDLKEVSICILEQEREDWQTVCTTSPYVLSHKVVEKANGLYFNIEFKDGSQLKLNLLSQFSYRGKSIQSSEQILPKVLIHRDGIKIADARQVVEFHWLQSHERNQKFPIDFRPLLLALPVDTQREIADYLCQKYALEPHRLFHLLTHTPNYRAAINQKMKLGRSPRVRLAGLASLFSLLFFSLSS